MSKFWPTWTKIYVVERYGEIFWFWLICLINRPIRSNYEDQHLIILQIFISLSVDKIYIFDQYWPNLDYCLDINLNNDVYVIALIIVTIVMTSYSPIKSSKSLLVQLTGRIIMVLWNRSKVLSNNSYQSLDQTWPQNRLSCHVEIKTTAKQQT